MAGVPYRVVVVAFTSAGEGQRVNPSDTFFSEELAPTKSVDGDSVKVDRISRTSVNMSWTPLTLREARGFPTYTAVLRSGSNRKKRQISFTVMTNNSYAVFTNLDESTTYSGSIAVRSSGAKGAGVMDVDIPDIGVKNIMI